LVFSLASLAGYARKSRAWQQPEFLLIPFIYPFVTNAVKTFHISIFPVIGWGVTQTVGGARHWHSSRTGSTKHPDASDPGKGPKAPENT
jgi:hypothetical protein